MNVICTEATGVAVDQGSGAVRNFPIPYDLLRQDVGTRTDGNSVFFFMRIMNAGFS